MCHMQLQMSACNVDTYTSVYILAHTLWSHPHLMSPVEGKVQAVSLIHYSLVPWHIGLIQIPLQVNLVHIYAKRIVQVVQPLVANVSGMGRLH